VIPFFTSDELKHYTAAILDEYGKEKVISQNKKRGRPKKPIIEAPDGLVYAQVHKHREKGRIKKNRNKYYFWRERTAKRET
jgi:hypothetical protein